MYLTVFFILFFAIPKCITLFPNSLFTYPLIRSALLWIYIGCIASFMVFFTSYTDILGVVLCFITVALIKLYEFKQMKNNPNFNGEKKQIADTFMNILNSRVTYEHLNEMDYKDGIDSNYIIAIHPHGVWPSSAFHYIIDPMVKTGKKNVMVVHDLIFFAPIIREIAFAFGIRDCSEKTIKDILNQKQNVVIMPGGEKEVINMQEGTDMVYIRHRKGIFRISLETGVPIIPIISYYENDLYSNLNVPWFRTLLKRLLNTSMVICLGDIPEFWLPKSKTVKMCCGKPILPQTIHGKTTYEKIENYRKTYVTTIRSLDHKYNPGRKLIIID